MLKIGHRGAAGLVPENTAAGFKKALELNLDLVELDVQLSKDDKLIVFHDYNLKRIAGIDKEIAELSLKELKKIDIGSWFGKEYKEERIMTLSEVIGLVRGQMELNIEVKPTKNDYKRIVVELLEVLAINSFSQQVTVSSFNHQLLKYLKSLNSNLNTAILIASLPIKPLKLISWAEADGLHPYYRIITQKLIDDVQAKDLMINTWTVNDSAEIEGLKQMGVDGIISDYPQRL